MNSRGAENALIVEVRLLGDRWHGQGDWPPSPFRLFQALVAGAFSGRWRSEGDHQGADRAFRWLESQPPPLVVAPLKRDAGAVPYYVPNNDLDAVGNDPRRSNDIPAATKIVKPVLLDSDACFAYVWLFKEGIGEAQRIATLSERLHTFGRGLDAAYARAVVEESSNVDARLASYNGAVAYPSVATDGAPGSSILPCPAAGSLDSLHLRFRESVGRFEQIQQGRTKATLFRQPPKAYSRLVAYDRPPRRLLFEIRELGGAVSFYPIRLELAVTLAKAVRDLAFEQLGKALTESGTIELLVMGRGATDADKTRRVRFIPLPSIGFAFTDPSIRRMLVEMPPDCPIDEADMRWALSGRQLSGIGYLDEETGEVRGAQLVATSSGDMLWNYGLSGRWAKRWQTVTPAVLPVRRPRGRIGGGARATAERAVAASVVAALRHAVVRSRVASIRVQREPFSPRGRRAEEFEHGRFDAAQLNHVEIVFEEALPGPLVVGDGRWIGLGLMRPVRGDGADDDNRSEAALPVAPDSIDEIDDDGEGDSEEIES